MLKELTVVILAAGKGTRMMSNTPKAMQLIGHFPAIDHLLNSVKKLNPQQIITVVNASMESLIEHIQQDSEIVYQDEQLGTAHAIYCAMQHFRNKNGNTLILLADSPLVSPQYMYQLINDLNLKSSVMNILSFQAHQDNEYGKLIINNNQVVEIIENIYASDQVKADNLCNSGTYGIKTAMLFEFIGHISNDNPKQEYFLTDLVKVIHNHNYPINYIIDETSCSLGANNKQELAMLENIFQEQKRAYFMEQGVTLMDPSSVYFSLDTQISHDVTIYPNVILLPRTVIHNNTVIFPNSVIEGSVIGEYCKIGPFARLRHGTILASHNNIGNFVEIKNSHIDHHTKINHLSYIGDTIIGYDTNIGAGTITCNYDGQYKYHTNIGNNCFIGSNTSLIAPIKIDDNAVIGAGSTITHSVQANHLGIARAQQINKIYKNQKK